MANPNRIFSEPGIIRRGAAVKTVIKFGPHRYSKSQPASTSAIMARSKVCPQRCVRAVPLCAQQARCRCVVAHCSGVRNLSSASAPTTSIESCPSATSQKKTESGQLLSLLDAYMRDCVRGETLEIGSVKGLGHEAYVHLSPIAESKSYRGA